ncbi:MAG TPA: nuclear transport factor 2 family protein [Thermoanaerobaculia bacterium]|nr:nuclear transport factor 2 family protein [Thermoanaerobaculia bacterium]
MKKLFVLLLVAFSLHADDKADLTKLLNDFLAGASVNDAAMHDRFWADDLIYTGSSGRRIGKADIMKDVRSAPPPKPDDPKVVFSAEDVRIQQYGTTAIVAFKLVATAPDGVATYLNSGTFLKRKNQWRVVNWQATILPRPEDETRARVAAVEAAFHRAMLAGDAKALEDVADESFVWTRNTGEQMTLKQLTAAPFKYAKPEPKETAIALYPSTAIIRGGAYTLTLVNRGGWRVVGLVW